jgi:acyl carrier protein
MGGTGRGRIAFAGPYPMYATMEIVMLDYQAAENGNAVIVSNQIEGEIAELIVQGLNLSIDAKDIDPDAPLFGEGLGLDSIDALEIALLIQKEYGAAIKQGDAQNAVIFTSIRSLSKFVVENRAN